MDILHVDKYIDAFYDEAWWAQDMMALRGIAEEHYVPIIRPEMEGVLQSLLLTLQPRKILEIGTGIGFSATFMARLLPDAQITTLELIEKRYMEARTVFSKYGVEPQIELITGDASVSLLKLINKESFMKAKSPDDNIDNSDAYDFIFIDSAKSRYYEFFSMAYRMSKPGTVIVCDNVLLDGRTASDANIHNRRDKTSAKKMREFVAYVKTFTGARTSLLGIGDGVTVSTVL
ncbi:MAG: O-methyltransferase [Clostridiales Family XIII bacterium]|jgi:predicted O-methyltransferase YrrM|nr:O-methyltransferase [Clostridiales Family XIII bacterium]